MQGGVIGVFLIATLTDHCCQLMVRCKYYAIEQIIEREIQKRNIDAAQQEAMRRELGTTLGYGDIGQTVFGTWCYHLIQFAVWFTQYTTCMCYFIFIGNTISHLYSTTPAIVPLNPGEIVNKSDDVRAVPMLFLPQLLNQGLPQCDASNLKLTPAAQFTTVTNNPFEIDLGNATTTWSNITNTTTTTPTTTTVATTAWSDLLPAPVSTAPDLRYIVMFPLGFFILTSLIRNMRLIAPFSTVATISLALGVVSVFCMIFVGKSKSPFYSFYPCESPRQNKITLK